MEILTSWKGVLNNGIACLKFNKTGEKLAAAATDDKHYVAVFDVKNKIRKEDTKNKSYVIGKAKGHRKPILDISWSDQDNFITVGTGCYQYWESSDKVDFKTPRNRNRKDNLLCSRYDRDKKVYLAGTSKGTL